MNMRSSSAKATQPTKQERLAEALRQNLQRRKKQKRARTPSADQRSSQT